MTLSRHRTPFKMPPASMLKAIIHRVGTPTYVYDASVFVGNIRAMRSALAPADALICYAMKANANLAMIKIAAREGCGADVVSGGELYVARQAGIAPHRIVFAGVGKTAQEIREGLRARILMFNVESLAEASAISREAVRMKRMADIAVRVNPDVDSESHHHYISTGKKENKFGVAWSEAETLIHRMHAMPGVRVTGLHVHIGSQMTSVKPVERAVKRILTLKDRLDRTGLSISRLDIGGGLGIRYRRERPPTAEAYAKALLPHLKGRRVQLICEPGRFLVGNAGYLVTRVVYRKQSHGKKFLIVDAGMNDLIRPSLYDAYHEIIPISQSSSRVPPSEVVDVVGPVCETGDFFAKERRMPRLEEGAAVAIMSAGAYGYTMSSNYNMRGRPAEVLVERGRWRVVRRRETYKDLLNGQRS